MPFTFQKTPLDGVIICQPKIFKDARGYFLESFNAREFKSLGLCIEFVQDNQSLSAKGTLRGLHFQAKPYSQDKLVRVIQGKIWDVAIDIRASSSSYGKWFGVELDDVTQTQLFIPKGFAHGFIVLSDQALVAYKTSDYYEPSADRGILWNDPDLAVQWPMNEPILSEKDMKQPLFKDVNFD